MTYLIDVMNIYQAWIDDEGVTFSTVDVIKEQKEKGLISASAKLIHTVEAETYEEAMKLHHEKMGWEPYRSFE